VAKIKEELPAELQAVVDKLAGLEQQKRDGALVPAYEIACELKKLKEGDMEFSDAVDKLRESLSWSQRTIDRYIKVREAIPPADFEELRAVRCSKGVRALSWTHFQILSRVSGKSDRKNVVKAWQKSDNDVDGVRSMEQMVNKMLKSGQDDPVPEMTAIKVCKLFTRLFITANEKMGEFEATDFDSLDTNEKTAEAKSRMFDEALDLFDQMKDWLDVYDVKRLRKDQAARVAAATEEAKAESEAKAKAEAEAPKAEATKAEAPKATKPAAKSETKAPAKPKADKKSETKDDKKPAPELARRSVKPGKGDDLVTENKPSTGKLQPAAPKRKPPLSDEALK